MQTTSNNHTTIYLDRNESQFGPAPECYDVLRRASMEELSNYSRDYARGVKSILSERLAREYDLPESNVLLSYGSEDMLKQIVHCYLSEGQAMMIPQHSWWYYKSVANEVDGNVIEYPMYSGELRFSYNIEEIVSLVRAVKPRLLLFASPNNPTGNALSIEEIEYLLSRCGDTRFVLDEAYFGFNDLPSATIPRLTQKYPHLAVLRTFSKLYALAGTRIGYAFVGASYGKLVTFSARYLGYNQLSERIALAAFDDRAYYKDIAAVTANERNRYYEFFDGVDGCAAYRSEANFILVKLPHEDRDSLRKHLTDAGIVIKFFSEKEFPGHARITIGRHEQNTLLLTKLQEYFVNERALISEPR
ncbi:MAG TPA: aminotransferase class I/II-fold pyridoxal phosphate-dependent enzyme [Bacteroidota bacterium]|nr:aminotransferase class I/II-fold pyridoxal phosphate-dependent enzyme [Bacteroidota bacterium]